eukprot:gene14966-20133_t
MPTFYHLRRSVFPSNVCVRSVHQASVSGFTAKSSAAYESGRPTYSVEALNRIMNVIKDNSSVDQRFTSIVELGAGTGKFTESFWSYSKQSNSSENFQFLNNLNYIATEPSDGFRQVLAKKVPSSFIIENGTSTSIPAPDKSIDCVIAAQAFHWMATEETLLEIHRVLKPNRPFIMIWNSVDKSVDWCRRIETEILDEAYGNTPRQQSGKWRNVYKTKVAEENFLTLQSWTGSYQQKGKVQLVYDRFISISVIADKSEEEQLIVKNKIKYILESSPELDNTLKADSITIPYTTEVAWVISK